jgi:hypothetical protein
MAITDYIPNIFGQAAPSYIQGLLGAEETQNLQNRANVQGLLGAGLALAQGMSRTGPRRSAAENVLGALAGGFGAAGGAYDQGVRNYMTQQQIAQTQLAQKQAANQLRSIEEAKLKYPDIAQLADIDRAKFAEEVALRQRMAGLGKQQGQQGPETPESLRAQAQSAYMMGPQFKPFADSLAERANRLEVESRLRPQAPTVTPQAQTATTEAPVITGEGKVLPGMTVVGQQGPDAQLLVRKNQLLAANQNLATVVSKEARDTIKANSDEIASIDKQLDRMSVSGYDFDGLKKSVSDKFKPQVDAIKQLAETGALPAEQVRVAIQEIYKQSQESERGMRLDGIVGTYAQMKYGTMDQTKLTPDQMGDIIRFQNAPDAAKTAELAREATKLQAELGVSAPVPAGRGEFVGRGGVRQQVTVPQVTPNARVTPTITPTTTTTPVAATEVAPQTAQESKFVPKSISDKALINQPSNVLPLVKRQELLQKQPATENLTRYTLRNIVDARDSARALLNNPEYIKSLTSTFSPLTINVPNTDAFTANQLLQNLLTRSFVSELQQMRTASPTGGAVGNVAIAEMEALSKIQGAMKPGMSEAEFKKQLEQYINVSERAMKDLPKEFARTYSYKGEFDDILSGTIVPPSGQKTPVQLELERRKAKKP